MSRTQTIEEHVTIPAGDASLSGILTYPADGTPMRAVLLCAPHPHFAGDMDNNVIHALAVYLADDSAVLRFDYHGVGSSEIDLPENVSVFDYWEDIEDRRDYTRVTADVQAAADALSDATGGLPLTIVGYSFGAVLGCMYGCGTATVERLIGFSPPLARVNLDFVADLRKPCLLLGGTSDFACSQEALLELASRNDDHIHAELLTDCDHFSRGQEDMVCEHVAAFIRRTTDKRTHQETTDVV